MKISRRSFLKILSCLPCFLIFPQTVFSKNENTYYFKNKTSFLNAFNETNEGAKEYLTSTCGKVNAKFISEEAAKQFQILLQRLPDVGGSKNMDTKYLIIGAWFVAYYRPMQKLNYSAEMVGRMIYDLNSIDLKNIPKQEALKKGAQKFTARNKLIKWSEWTQQRQYPANWVAEYVKGNGKDFDFGYNYTECAICKYFNKLNVAELAPFVCLNDFTRSRALGTGLSRTKTLGQGDEICNFRYKKGRPVTQNWNTEISIIRENLKKGRVCTV